MQFPLLAGLGEDDRRHLLSQARRRQFGRREVIFHEGDPGESLYLVAAGHVGIRITTPLGDAAMLRVLQPGEFFGELALLSPGPRSATALSLESAETLTINRTSFGDLRERSPMAVETVMTALATEVRRLASALVEALYLPADKRVYRRLIEIASAYNGSASREVPLTQDEIAQLAGTTRPTANRVLTEARDAGAIVLSRGHIAVLDYAWLERRGC